MKGIILLNGEPYENLKEDSEALVYCCDGAYLWSKDKIHIDENLGDFDSLNITPYPPPKEIYPEEKDYTDGEIAVRKMVSLGVDEITIYGGGGKREDHFLSNLHLMYYAYKKGVKCAMVTNFSKMFFCSGENKISGVKGRTVSLIPIFEEAEVTASRGLYYPLNNLILRIGESRGVSNLAVEEDISFLVKSGSVLLCVNNNKKGEDGG